MISDSTCKLTLLPVKKMHNHFSIMHFHAQNMQKIVLEKSGYAKLSTEVHRRSGLGQPRHGLDEA